MRFLRTGTLIMALGLCAHGQTAPAQTAQAEAKGIPPRAAPSDYQAHAQAGKITLAADFTGHSVATPEGVLNAEDYVSIELGVFGPPEARLALSVEDFSLRINGKKPQPSQPYAFVLPSLKDPEWEPPSSTGKSKTNVSGTGKDQPDLLARPGPVVYPFEKRRSMEQSIRKVQLPLGDRALPQAGLLFFQYNGRSEGIRSIELIYSGPAGKATLSIQP